MLNCFFVSRRAAATSFLSAGMAALAGCGAETLDKPAETTRVDDRPATTQDLDNAFSAPPGKGIAIVNGSQAATINVTMPDYFDSLSEKLQTELSDRANSGTEAFIAAAEADQEAARSEGFEFRPHALDIVWERSGPAEGRLTGFVGTYTIYTGGAHSNLSFDKVNWDLKSDKPVGFDDIFDDADTARERMSSLLKEGLLTQKRERLGDTQSTDEDILKTWVDPALDAQSALFDHFSVIASTEPEKAGGIVYHFAPYEVGAYAEGVYVVTLPYRGFEDLLGDTYRSSFGGEPRKP
ncbi:RsiV family protein [Henriciella sp. AS95]|uniref:RsiV family protein n=1 Tax=Henriciella sp. AS95 TaxID=3135782 RepID=UPI00317B5F5B